MWRLILIMGVVLSASLFAQGQGVQRPNVPMIVIPKSVILHTCLGQTEPSRMFLPVMPMFIVTTSSGLISQPGPTLLSDVCLGIQ